MNLVACKWIFKTKKMVDGSLDRYKAWLVTKDYLQYEGLDDSETYNPVVKPITIWLIISLAISSNWVIW